MESLNNTDTYYDDVQHPYNILKSLANEWNLDFYSRDFALKLDESNLWPSYRDRFFYPKLKDLPKVDLDLIENPDGECIYLCGNSLGLQAKSTRDSINESLDKWAKMGAYGHNFAGKVPCVPCDVSCQQLMAELVGASFDEVYIMNFLSVNLHLMMVLSFYNPTKDRKKILLEYKAFPSDHYIVESQIKLHDLNPEDCMVLIKPREGESCIRTEDIMKVLEEEGEQIALVLFSGVQYYTGQLFQIKEITEAAHKKGCYVGWDLAHAVGNVELKLHDWNVDFAAWGTYKYLNSGAGGIGAIFLHEKHFNDISSKKKLDGWWSHRLETRFNMTNKMEYAKGASAYAISCPSMLLCSSLFGSLQIFKEVGMKQIRGKSKVLTTYLEAILTEKNQIQEFEFLTPKDPEERGAHLSIIFKIDITKFHLELEKRGVACDFRSPNVLRFAPIALYNNFDELFRFVFILSEIFKN